MSDIVRVTEPIEVSPDEDGFLIKIVSGKRTFLFHASRHKVRNINHVVRSMLDREDRAGRETVEPLRKRAPKGMV